MQATSQTWKSIVASGAFTTECTLAIGEAGLLLTHDGDRLMFGNDNILIGSSGADAGYGMDRLISVETTISAFSGEVPAVGATVAGEIDVVMLRPLGDIPRQARLAPYIRVKNATAQSEWIQKGVFYIDTREEDGNASEPRIKLHGFDAMLRAEAPYPSSTLIYPALDTQVVQEIAKAMAVRLASGALSLLNKGYRINYPAGYTQREVLGYIGAMYAGCWSMSDTGELQFIKLNGVLPETRYLLANATMPLVIGGDKILV